MGFKQYYNEVIKRTGDIEQATEKYIRVLWGYGYSLDQAIHTINSND